MKIRIIGEKAEIKIFLNCLSRLVPVSTRRLCKAREGGYRCYIDVDSKDIVSHNIPKGVEYTENIITIREFLSMLSEDYYMIVINYYMEEECKYCGRVFMHKDPEYSSQFFLSDIKKMFKENTGYYSEYPFIFDDTLIDIEEDIEIYGNRITIDIYDERPEKVVCSDILKVECRDASVYYGEFAETLDSAKDYPDIFFY